ncbi:MAG TPA: putative capsular polysaccharide synthesis family protein [Candidatus Hydrogenedentes bacterium]|nr:putative capsular polysaccharide synthesis family protein [Candidatus Hydrogenedentota bacterium]HPU96780.1 putative capsular polysaccharide synthesis family protein [Candidatus Hydrogenedentota bacterium]
MLWLSSFRDWWGRRNAPRHVIVFQPGKVGSSTLTATLKASAPHLTVHQVHFLTHWRINRFREIIALPDTPADYRIVVGKLIRESEEALGIIKSAAPGEVVVISGFRDPLDRNVSAFAQNFPFFLPDLTFDPLHLEREVKQVIGAFESLWEEVRSIPADAPVSSLTFRQAQGRWLLIDSCLDWFEKEFCPVIGVSMRKLRPGNKPWKRFYRNGITVLLYRYEALWHHMRAMLETLPLESWQPVDRNVSSAKKYGQLLKRWRETWQPPPEMVRYFYESEYYRCFYPQGVPRFPVRSDT